MSGSVDVDVWVRGTLHATTRRILMAPPGAEEWTEADVRKLLSEMLRALEREKNPGGPPHPLRSAASAGSSARTKRAGSYSTSICRWARSAPGRFRSLNIASVS
jgi:hypothetical protein